MPVSENTPLHAPESEVSSSRAARTVHYLPRVVVFVFGVTSSSGNAINYSVSNVDTITLCNEMHPGAVRPADTRLIMQRTGGSQESPESLLRAAVARVFPSAQLMAQDEVDPEEGWKRRVLCVATGVEDFDKRLALEDEFYDLVAGNERLARALRDLTVSFT